MKKQDRIAERGRFWAKRNREAVLRLLKGKELNALPRELGVTATALGEWRETFLARAEANPYNGDHGGRATSRRELMQKQAV